jgi:hypothetical protein
MANHAASDPQDWAVWQAVHDSWAELVNAEMEHRRGRASVAYSQLLESFGNVDAWSSETRGSSMSRLSDTQAFERGYQGGWR